MNEVYRVIGVASRRLMLIDLLRALAVTLTVTLGALVVARIVQQAFNLDFPWSRPYGGVFAWAGVAAVGAAILWTAIARRRVPTVARELDERAGLRESLSTALYAEGQRSDPWCTAVIETAQARAARVNVRQAVPLRAPGLWPVPIGCAAVLAALWFTVKPFDVLGAKKRETAKQADIAKVSEVKRELEDKEKKLDELMKNAKLDLKSEDVSKLDSQKHDEPLKPEDLQRAAVKKLTDVSEKLAEMRNGDKGQNDQAMRDKMEQLKQPGDGPLNELSRALSRGNFEKAEEALKDLKQKLEAGNLTEEQKAQLKAQLQNLSDQMKKLAQDQKQLEQKLEGAGLDPKAAKELLKQMKENPQAAKEMLKQALEASKGLSEEQKKQLMQQAMSQSKAGGQCDKMGEAMSKMAQGMSQQGMDKEGMEGMGQMSASMSDAGMTQDELKAMDAAMGECRAQLVALGECLGDGEGPPKLGEWQPGSSNSRGNGSGGKGGLGNYGGQREDNPADFTTKKEKANTKTNGGPIIGSKLVYGEQVRGESVAEFSATVEASEKAAAEAIENYQVPVQLQPAVKSYFGTLSKAAQGKDAAGAPAPKPAATDAKDAGAAPSAPPKDADKK